MLHGANELLEPIGTHDMGRCFNSTVLNAPVDEVWKTIRDFHDMSWGSAVITSCQAVGEVGADSLGAKRILNGAFHETLQSIDDEAHCFSYTIDDGPEPLASDSVSNYIGTVRLRAVTDVNQTYMEWESSYESKDDALVADFCNPIYAALLEALKIRFAS